ncbi:calcium-binding protein [Sphingomonas psychrotolerans]|uniref:calcium-binding protein n=1 Tax=Sphingomonas psychrotolerans TaxID=1327635 RepID=UPI0013052626|nr:hypothetical protein [Sphingomonas psychrotolerans]
MANITGTNGDDTLNGTDGDDWILGEGGDDVIKGGLGNDVLNGGAGHDVLNGGVGDDILNGGDDDDWLDDMGNLNAAGGSDTLNGGRGNDTLRIYRSDLESGASLALNGGDGNDTIHFDVGSNSYRTAITQVVIDGGIGDDRVEIAGSGFNADIRLGSGRDTIWLGNLRSFLNWSGYDQPTTMVVRDFAAGDAGDVLDWTAVLPINLIDWDQNSNPFGSGHARLTQSGSDSLLQVDINGGADGYQTLFRFENAVAADFTAANFSGYAPDGSVPPGQTLTGTGANDVLTGTVGDDEIRGEAGIDEIDGRAGADRIFGGDGNDTIEGGMGDDVVEGGAGRDYIYGGKGADMLRGGADDDIIGDGDSGGNSLYGEGGNDDINMYHGVHGETGTSYLDGGDGDDRIGVSLYSESHVDVSAGAGADLVYLEVERGSANVNLGAGTDTVRLDFYPSGYGFITGTIVLADFVAGDGGERLEFRHHVAKVLDGWDPATNPFATGYLRLVQSGTSAVLEVDFFRDGKGYVPYVIFENTNAAELTPYNLDMLDGLVVYGTEGSDTIDGTVGDDTIMALGGLDSIFATRGRDVVDGGAGNDWLDVYAARIGLAAGPRHYTITADKLTDASGALDTSFTGIEMISLDDRTGNVTVDASAVGTIRVEAVVWAGAHDVKSGAGNDQISVRGGGGAFDGGAGDDWLWVERDNSTNGNTLFVTEAGGVTTLSQAGSASLTGRNFEKLDIVGTGGALRVDASAVSRAIGFSGTAAADSIIGSTGANQIDSKWDGLGAGDVFTGGGGNDWFTFWTFAGLAGATITDFSRGDQIDLHLIGNARFIGTAAFSGVAGEIRYTMTAGQTQLIGDANGDGVGDSVLTFSNRATMLRETSAGSKMLQVAANVITGTNAGEILFGSTGDDDIFALGGMDAIKVSKGIDTVDGGAGIDAVELVAQDLALAAGPHGYTVTTGRLTDASGAIDTSFTAVEQVRLFDWTGSDVTLDASTLTGAALTVNVRAGTHALTGSGGADLFLVGGGSGTVDGGGGNDRVVFTTDNAANANAVLVTQSGGATVLAQAGGPSLGVRNMETIEVAARAGSGLNVDASASMVGLSFLLSNAADIAKGGTGADVFSVTSAANGTGDLWTGGGGADLFSFAGVAALSGTITDLGADDTIQVTGLAPNGSFIGGREFTGAGGEFRYVSGRGLTALLGDADGDMVADSILLITNGAFVLAETSPTPGILKIVGQLPPNDEAANVITGTDGVDYLDGGEGNDTIDGRGGNDVLNGNDDDDHILGGAGTDVIHGGYGNDVLDGGLGNDSVSGDDGDDVITATGAAFDPAEWLDGGYGDDLITAINGEFNLFGGEGNDRLRILDGRNHSWLVGEAGDDVIYATGTGAVTVSGDDGDDEVTVRGFTSGHVMLGSGSDKAWISGSGIFLHMTEFSGTGQDVVKIEATGGLTVIGMSAGEAGDVLDLSAYGADPFGTGALTIVGDRGSTYIRIAATGALIELRNVVAANLSAYNLGVANPLFAPQGMTIDDAFAYDPTIDYPGQLAGADGDDTIRGFGGDDILLGAGGNDRLEGGIGNDRLDGGSGNDTLDGGAGDDVINGGAGNDRIDSLAGVDTIRGGTGDDVVIVADAATQVLEAEGEGTDVVQTDISYALAAGSEIEQLAARDALSTAGIALTGNEFANMITGNAGANTLDGGGGSDWLNGGGGDDMLSGGTGHDSVWGGEGNDLLDGGDGDDTLFGGAGTDTASYALASAGVEIDLSILEEQLTRGAGVDTLVSIENVTGSAFDDVLAGGAGANVLTGGAGNDRFVFGETGLDVRDTIADFATGDLIDLSRIDANGAAAGDAAFAWIGGAGFGGVAGQLRVTGAGASWRVEGDLNGDGAADFSIAVTTLTPGLGLAASDFLL